jgi:heptosyltransferase II
LRPQLFPTATHRLAADTILDRLCDEPVIVLAPGSRRTTKRWPYFVELAALLPERARIVVIGGAEDRSVCEAIEAICAHSGKTMRSAIGVPLLTAAALVEKAQLVVCNDSVALHMAAAFDVPVVALFGPTIPAGGFAPLSRTAVTVEAAHLSCRPCGSGAPRVCPQAHWRCMRDLRPETVALHAERLLHHEVVVAL